MRRCLRPAGAGMRLKAPPPERPHIAVLFARAYEARRRAACRPPSPLGYSSSRRLQPQSRLQRPPTEEDVPAVLTTEGEAEVLRLSIARAAAAAGVCRAPVGGTMGLGAL